MSKTLHTSGPWRHSAVDGGWDGVDSDHGLICKLSLNVPANARLIAAAPELLEVCVEAESLWPVWMGTPDQKEFLDRLRAAISKATGEEAP